MPYEVTLLLLFLLLDSELLTSSKLTEFGHYWHHVIISTNSFSARHLKYTNLFLRQCYTIRVFDDGFVLENECGQR
jgi:hypothetical protein